MISLLEKKIINQESLSQIEALTLAECNDLIYLGQLARYVKEKISGKKVFFNVNRHLNLTNICISRCKFCAFSRDVGEEGAYVLSKDEIIKKVKEALPLGITELHIVSGLHPYLPFSYYLEIIQMLHQEFPEIHLQAFTAVEIDYFAQISGQSIKQVLITLKEAGLGSLPGGGAEIFNAQIRRRICPKKASGKRWLEVMNTAHDLGLKSNATILYGHLEKWPERIEHLLMLRKLQARTGGFQAFIPLPFHPEKTCLKNIHRTHAAEDLKMMALARIILNNIPHIKAFWIMLGLPIAQLSLDFGADDLDGTVIEEKITHAAGAKTEQGISKDKLIEKIKEMGYIPVERDTLYRVMRSYGKEDLLETKGGEHRIS